MVKKSTQIPGGSQRFDPDVRFLLANERTLLAWIRTAIAILAGGLALSQVGDTSATKNAFSVLVMSLGGIMVIIGFIRYRAADKAIRIGELPSMGTGPAVQTGIIIFIAITLVATHFLGVW